MVRKEKQVTQLQNWKSQDTTSYAGFSQKKRAMLSDSWIKEKNMFSGGQKGIEKAEIITNLSHQTEIVWLQIFRTMHKNDYCSSDKVTVESFLKCQLKSQRND